MILNCAKANSKYYMKYSSQLENCPNRSIATDSISINCDSLSSIELRARNSAENDASQKRLADYEKINPDNKMLLTGETNCNSFNIFDSWRLYKMTRRNGRCQ